MIKPNNISPIKDYAELLKENENLKEEICSLKKEKEQLNWQIQDLNERRECLIEEKANNLDYRDLILLIKEVLGEDLDSSDIFFIYDKIYDEIYAKNYQRAKSKPRIPESYILINFIKFCLKNDIKITTESIIEILNNKKIFFNYSPRLSGLLKVLSSNFEKVEELKGIKNINVCEKYIKCIGKLCITNLIGW